MEMHAFEIISESILPMEYLIIMRMPSRRLHERQEHLQNIENIVWLLLPILQWAS